MKLNASKCHLLKMNSIRGFLRTLCKLWLVWIFRIPILGNTCRSLFLYVLDAHVFWNTSKWMLSSLSNWAIFFSEYFYLKNHQKKHVPSFSLLWGERIQSVLFIMFSSLIFTPSFFKNFPLLTKHKEFDFFKATLSTLNIIYIKLIYIKSSFGFTFE